MEKGRTVSAIFLLLIIFLSASAVLTHEEKWEIRDQEIRNTDFDDLNILFITSEALRRDKLGYGKDDTTLTPNIDELAEESIRFNNAVSPSGSTIATFSTVFTSRYNFVDNVYDYGTHYFNHNLSLVSKLVEEGYEGLGVVPHPLLLEERGFGGHFEEYIDRPFPRIREGVDDEHVKKIAEKYVFFPEYDVIKENFTEMTADQVTENAKYLLEKRSEENNFFMWLHYFEPHNPYMPPEKEFVDHGTEDFNGSYSEEEYVAFINEMNLSERDIHELESLYDSEIRYMDYYIGELLDYLNEEGLKEDTLIVFSSDHGECFGEGQIVGHSNIHDCSVEIPLTIYIPGEEGYDSPKPVSLIDLFPTFFDLLDIQTEQQLRGESMFKDFDGRRSFRYLSEDPQRRTFGISEWHQKNERIILDRETDSSKEEIKEFIRDTSKEYANKSTTTDVTNEEIQKRMEDIGY